MKKLNKFKVITALTVVPLISLFIYPAASYATPVINQGSTGSFALLSAAGTTGNAGITGTAGTAVGDSGGIAPTGTLTGGTPVYLGGPATTANTELTTAINDVNAPANTSVIADELNTQVIHPGSYTSTALGFQNSGTVTFDGGGDPNAIFLMRSPTTLTTAVSSHMLLTGQAQACNIFWAIGSAAALGTTSSFVGHMYAHSGVHVSSGVTIYGNLLTKTADISLLGDTVVNDNCAPAVIVIPAAVQLSTITSVAPANCVLTGTTAITINGGFPTPISNIIVNGTAVAVGSWTQTATTVTVNAVTSSTIPTVIQIFNGQTPVLAAQSFTCTPAAVVIPVPTPTPTPTPTPVVTPVAPGTIHVVKTVVNGYGGTATAADFTLSLRHHGVDVAGSPDVGMSSPGRIYVLAPGTYVLGEAVNPAFPNYISSFSIVGQTTNDIVLTSGADLTIMETNTQIAPVVVATVAPVVATPPPVVVKVVTGGKLPKTGSPWYNMLLLSAGLVLLGGVGARFGKTARNK